MNNIKVQLIILGSGPGGYNAAFRASDLGLKVILVERYENIGGVCLNVGCIPSKILLHIVKIINETKYLMSEDIIKMNNIIINKEKIIQHKNNIVRKVQDNIKNLAKIRKIKIIQGYAKFISNKEVSVVDNNGKAMIINFENCIIATGSSSIKLPLMPKDDRIMYSTDALQIREIPKSMLVVGGGIIGLEMAQVYCELGTKITVIESSDQLINGVDKDIIKAYEKMNKSYKIFLKTTIRSVNASLDGIHVKLEDINGCLIKEERYDKLLIAVGRKPNTDLIDIEKAGINIDKNGFIKVDKQLRTSVSHIFAIGDITGQPMLAHKAISEGKIAAEVISGLNHIFDPLVIPYVAYTNPEVAWVGETETSAKFKGLKYTKSFFPWYANGKSLTMNRSEGITKILFNENNKIIGSSIVGINAGELISEAALAIEMGCNVEDISLTIHPHPTLSESFMMAAEVYEGTVTDILSNKVSYN